MSDEQMSEDYVEHLRAKRDLAADQTALPPMEMMLAEAAVRSESDPGSDGRPARQRLVVLSTAAAVVLLVIGVVFVVSQRRPLTVATGGEDGTPGSVDRNEANTPLDSGDLLDGLPLFFPAGPTGRIQARINGDSEVVDDKLLVDSSVETFVAGAVGEPAKLITIVSTSRADAGNWIQMLRLDPVRLMPDSLPGDPADRSAELGWLADQIVETAGADDTKVSVRELGGESVPSTAPMLELWLTEYSGKAVDLRIVRIVGEGTETFVLASNVDAATVDRVVADLVVDDDGRTQTGSVPAGFDRLGPRSTSGMPREAYGTIAPPVGGQMLPIRLRVERLDDAGALIAIMTNPFVDPVRPMILETGPDWVVGTGEPGIAMGVRDGAWVSVGNFTIGAPEMSLDELRSVWAGVKSVDRHTFDEAIARRSGGVDDLFADEGD